MNLLERIDQPTLLVNEQIVRRNIARMAARAQQNGVAFRPHFKTHQSAQVGEWFRAYGVERITASSVEMAEYFAAHGWQDITIAFSLNIRQMERIRALAAKIHLGLLVENAEEIASLAVLNGTAVDVWIKVDVGNHRTGIDWQEVSSVAALCRQVKAAPALTLRGLLTHSGHTYKARGDAAVCALFREGIERLNWLRAELAKTGFDGLKISAGDTPGCTLCEDWSGADEMRPGNFVFYDAQQYVAGVCRFEDIAAAVACPVVAKHAERREVVLYGGAIHLSKDFQSMGEEKSYGLPCLPQGEGWGQPIPGALVKGLSQEHGIVYVPGAEFEHIKVGDLLFVIPAHSCLTVQVLRKYHTLDGQEIQTLNV